MNLLRITTILAIVMYAGYWLNSATRQRKQLEHRAEDKAIEGWEGEGGNVVD